MNKKFLCYIFIFLCLSFCTGIFVEILSTENLSIKPETPSFFSSLFSYFKSDIFTVALCCFFACTVILLPCVGLVIVEKTFALGFSAAYLISSLDQGLPLLCLALLPRGILKMPIYILLLLLSFKTAKDIKRSKSRKSNKRQLYAIIGKRYGFCTICFMVSSLIEVCLLQAVL